MANRQDSIDPSLSSDKSQDKSPNLSSNEPSKQSKPILAKPVVIQIAPANEAPRTATGRRRSSVTFKEKCDMIEVDLKKKPRRDIDKGGPKKPPALKSMRYYIMLLALISPFVTTYSKTIINFAITDMIDLEYLEQMQRETRSLTTTTYSPLSNQTLKDSNLQLPYFDIDNSCPVSDEVRARLLKELDQDVKRARTTSGEKFKWNTDTQGHLKAAYSIGHAMTQIIGGRLSEIYGSHYIMSISSLLIGICCLSAPYLAAIQVYLLCADLLVLGMLGSFMTPSLITLFSNWLTPSEKSMTLSLYLVSSRLGYAFSSFLCSRLIGAQLSWRYLFFSAGWIGITFAVSFYLFVKSRPQDHMLMTQSELDYLASKNILVRENLARDKEKKLRSKESLELKDVKTMTNQGEKGTKKEPSSGRKSAPWSAILVSTPVWAFVITKFCVKLAGDTVQIELPTYLKRVMHFSSEANGNLNSLNYVIFCISCLAIGALAKYVNKNRPFGLSKTANRKIFQSISSFGVALMLLGNSYSVCNDTWTIIFLELQFLITTFGTGGEAQIPLDITERYSGTIHAIGSSIAVSGAIAPIIIGYFLKGRASDRERWAGVWFGASVISAIGGFVFLFFADATIQPFDSIVVKSKDEPKESETSSNPEAGKTNRAFERSTDLSAEQPTFRESSVI